ncbi:hypothetical protein GMES_1825 [Paraglaciecola mesophila KMM 241]|uniref:Uncharacterized protein n=1 Tax=Paraglaciecola mesophila KMM 241 TaxID=1128912 RepID=K6YJE7_9ALTE|nr:hypothetical protein GMES_1825 [Paraglaciecola mesophila KMM 241]
MFIDVVDIAQVTVFSGMSAQLKSAFAEPNAVFMIPTGGFVRKMKQMTTMNWVSVR